MAAEDEMIGEMVISRGVRFIEITPREAREIYFAGWNLNSSKLNIGDKCHLFYSSRSDDGVPVVEMAGFGLPASYLLDDYRVVRFYREADVVDTSDDVSVCDTDETIGIK